MAPRHLICAVIPALFVATSLPSALAASSLVQLHYYVTPDRDAYRLYATGPAQRCYLFTCLNEVVYVSWERMQAEALIAFYDQIGCHGVVKTRPSADGKFYSYEFGTGTSIRSLIVWESGRYSTRGIENMCLRERSPLLLNASSFNQSGSGWSNNDTIFGGEGEAYTSCVGVDNASNVSASD